MRILSSVVSRWFGVAGVGVVAAGCVFVFSSGCELGGGGGGKSGGNVAIIQYEVQDPDSLGVDPDRMEGMIRKAAKNGAKLVVTPETAFYRYSPFEENGVTMVDLAQTHGELEQKFSALAAELQIYLVIGFREPAGSSKTYNTAVLYGPDGHQLARHRKMAPSEVESPYTVGVMDVTVVNTPVGRIGLAICKDVDEQPVQDAYAAAGMDLFILPAGDADGHHLSLISKVCTKAGCYGILADQLMLDGNSGWVDPDGTIDYIGGGEKTSYHDIPLFK